MRRTLVVDMNFPDIIFTLLVGEDNRVFHVEPKFNELLNEDILHIYDQHKDEATFSKSVISFDEKEGLKKMTEKNAELNKLIDEFALEL